MRDIRRKSIICIFAPVRGRVTSDISSELLQLPTDTCLKNIILKVGSNDCVNHNLVKKSFKSICENVVVSGLCPQLDDREVKINRGSIIL